MVKPEPWENPMLDTMWSFMQMGGLKANYPALKKSLHGTASDADAENRRAAQGQTERPVVG